MPSRRLVLLAALAVGSAVGCGREAGPEDSEDRAEIQAGEVERGYPAVGLLHFDGEGDDFCSGTLISPTLVLTAGHCVNRHIDGFYTGLGTPVTFDTGSEWWKQMKPHAVLGSSAHPRYGSPVCSEDVLDVGLVRLQDPILDIRPAQLPNENEPRISPETTCRAIGYGDNSIDPDGGRVEVDTTFGQKRSALVDVTSVTSTRVFVRKRTGIPDPGDSGGPLFCGERVVGVDSCGVDRGGSGPAHEHESFGAVAAAAAWIRSEIDR